MKPDFVVDGEGYRIVNSAHDTRATMATLRATYLLTKRTAVYAQSSYLGTARMRATRSAAAGTTPGEGMGQLGAMVGVRHMF